jgi:ribosomal protein S18 acetylase RimI-like enzyme
MPSLGTALCWQVEARKDGVVTLYRTFRNTDPPAVSRLWNLSFTERGAVAFRHTTLLEYFLFAKPYFDPASFWLASTETGEVIGFALSGFGPSADGQEVDRSTGVICLLCVHPSYRRQGIATELLRRSEAYLNANGCRDVFAGPRAPLNPYTFGLYGGSNSPGFLDSDPLAGTFFLNRGYQVARSCLVLQRPMANPLVIGDGRFASLRQQLEIVGGPLHRVGFWRDAALGPVEVYDYRLRDRTTPRVLASCTLWEMETFSMRWNEHAIGFVDLQVNADRRRQGLGRFLLSQLLRHLQDQFFSLAEFQIDADNNAALALLQGLGFQHIDTGRQYRKV